LFEDVHIEEGYLKVLGKGNKERVVPIGSLAQKVLWRYVFHFRPEPLGETNEYLFLSLDLNTWDRIQSGCCSNGGGREPVYRDYMLISAVIPMPRAS